MKHGLSVSIWIVLSLLATATTGASEPRKGAKELFYDPGGGRTLSVNPAPPPAEFDSSIREVSRRPPPITDQSPSQLGLSYWIELVEADGDAGHRVTEQRIFQTGERIRLHFMSNRDGRISLLQAGPTGKPTMLFPDPGKRLIHNALRAGEERILPNASAWFRFDQNTGEERIFAVFAADQQQLDSTLRPAAQGQTLLASVRSGSKDLVLEVDTESAAEVGTYAVNTAGQPIVLEIVLMHE